MDNTQRLRLTRFGTAVKNLAMTNQRINENIRAELARQQMTQTQVAELLELTQSGVSSRLRGETRWKVDELTRLAEALRIDVAVLLSTTRQPAAS